MIAVTLNSYELAQAGTTGLLRNIAALKRGYKNKNETANWQNHVEGACGEVAVAKLLGKYWGGSINTFKEGGDLDATGWEVRTRSSHHYDLIIRKDDADDRVFILVTGNAPNYQVHGWILGADGKHPKYYKEHPVIGQRFFVPQADLISLGSLKWVLPQLVGLLSRRLIIRSRS